MVELMRYAMWPPTFVLAAVGLAACGSNGGASDDPRVVASVYPLRFIADRIVGNNAEVVDLTPSGQEPHDIELTSDQITASLEADLLLYIDEGFQPALEDVVPDAQGDVIDALDEITGVIETDGQVDPHFWLDPQRLGQVVQVVPDTLGEVDSENEDSYRANAEALGNELFELDSDFARGLDDCDRRVLVTAHESFGYLADRYDLEQIGIAGVDPEAEPSPQRLAEIADLVGEHDVTTIFFEELVSPDVAETIADETGATTAALHTLETPPEDGDYFAAMRDNLETLKTALGCS